MTLLYIFSTPLVSDRIFYLLENSIQKPSLEEIPKVEAIVVLSGMISYVKAGTHSGNEWSDPDRFFAGIDLFNENKADVLVFTEASLPWSRSEIAEGVLVEEGAVISMGVYIGASTKIVDRSTGEITFGKVPAYSVVVPGSLPNKSNPDGPSLYCAVIVKKVDSKTRSKTSINDLLRD